MPHLEGIIDQVTQTNPTPQNFIFDRTCEGFGHYASPRKLLFAGDIHGNAGHLQWVFRRAETLGATDIVACGDFGYWPHYTFGQEFLELAEVLTHDTGIILWWVDGNHENHDLLDQLAAQHGTGAPIAVAGPDVRWIPRGCTVDFGGVTLMGFGGAYSIDWDIREPGVTFWAQETITRGQVEALTAQKVDILVTHEAPQGMRLGYKDSIPESVAQRDLVQEIQDKVQPALHVCGHHHVQASWTNGGTEVRVLGRDGMNDLSVMLVDLAERFGKAPSLEVA